MIVIVVVMLLFGGRGKISGMMGDFAQGIKAFKKGMAEDDKPDKGRAGKTIEHPVRPRRMRRRPKAVRRADAEVLARESQWTAEAATADGASALRSWNQMLGLNWGKLVVIGIVALIVIGPKELPTVLRTIGHWMGKVRRMANEFQGQFQEAMREAEMTDLQKQVEDQPDSGNRLPTSIRWNRAQGDRAHRRRRPRSGCRTPRRAWRAGRQPGVAPAGEAASAEPVTGPPAQPSAETRSLRHRRRRAKRRDRSPPSMSRRRRRGRRMTHEDIEATKAPLMEHLVELRSRLIKAVAAFAVMFVLCFIFAKNIYNVLVWPFVWVAGPENSKFIFTALLEYFVTQLKFAMFGAAFLSFPVVATQIYMFVAPGLYRQERKAFRPYLIATPFFFALGAPWCTSSFCRR